MPKKKKNSQNKEEDDSSSREGRPSGLTLGDFISKKAPPRGKTTAPLPFNQVSAEAENVECLSSTSEMANVAYTTNIVQSDDSKVAALCEQIDDGKKTVRSAYFVCRTKKGRVPVVKVENRSSGKKVTLIEHVGGDGKSLVHDLKMKFGTGGLYKDNTIELQGDCKQKVTKYLNENKSLLKPYGTK